MSSSTIVVEGKAHVKLPRGVFYNPVQEFNRDVTLAAIRQYEEIYRSEWAEKTLGKLKNPSSKAPTEYPGLQIFEGMSASGLRSVRFALELACIQRVFANDLDPSAVELIRENIALNKLEHVVETTCGDVVDIMHQHKSFEKRFTVVDIDPFGTASPFLDAAVQCLHDGGLLCVTSTDMAVLTGSTPGTAMGKYGGMSIKGGALHECGLRLLLHAIQSAASRHGKVIEPLLSLSVDFYARVFVRVRSSPSAVKAIATKHSICFQCPGCTAYHLQPLGREMANGSRVAPANGPCVGPNCAECGSAFQICGPFWSGQLHSPAFLQRLLTGLGRPPVNYTPGPPEITETQDTHSSDAHNALYNTAFPPFPSSILTYASNLSWPVDSDVSKRYGTYKRIVGMTTIALEELDDCPLYYKLDKLAATIGCIMPRLKVLRSAFLHAGYRISLSHADTNTIKTDAPPSFIWDVMVSWHRQGTSPNVTNTGATNEGKQIKVANALTSFCENNNAAERSKTSDQVRSILLNRIIKTEIDFTLHPLANPPSRAEGLMRYQPNPEKYWGPKSRPKKPKQENQIKDDELVDAV